MDTRKYRTKLCITNALLIASEIQLSSRYVKHQRTFILHKPCFIGVSLVGTMMLSLNGGGMTDIRVVGDIMIRSRSDAVSTRESLIKLGAALQTPI